MFEMISFHFYDLNTNFIFENKAINPTVTYNFIRLEFETINLSNKEPKLVFSKLIDADPD